MAIEACFKGVFRHSDIYFVWCVVDFHCGFVNQVVCEALAVERAIFWFSAVASSSLIGFC